MFIKLLTCLYLLPEKEFGQSGHAQNHWFPGRPLLCQTEQGCCRSRTCMQKAIGMNYENAIKQIWGYDSCLKVNATKQDSGYAPALSQE